MKATSTPSIVVAMSYEEASELREFLSKTSDFESSVADRLDEALALVGVKIRQPKWEENT